MPTVTIKRDSGYADSFRRYKVFLDGTLVAKIAREPPPRVSVSMLLVLRTQDSLLAPGSGGGR
jgi:hypothetical protein